MLSDSSTSQGGRSQTLHSGRCGFTLLEVICVLTLLGLIGTMAFSGLFAGVREYIVVRQITRDAELMTLARARLHKEIRAAIRLVCTPDSLQFQTHDGLERTISLNNNMLLIEGQPLLRGVKGSFARPHYPDGTEDRTGIIISLEMRGIPCELEVHPIMLLP